MLHILLLAAFTAGVATLTFALMVLASVASVGFRSSALAASGRGATLSAVPARSPSVASDGTRPAPGSETFPGARRGSTPDRSECGA